MTDVTSWVWGPGVLSGSDYLALFVQFSILSLLAIGGAITTVPDMHRFVTDRHWLDDAQFTASVALAQAAPGPNVLFVALIGFGVGGLVGLAATLAGSLLPSTVLVVFALRWGAARRESKGVRAFTAGLAPLTIGLLLATGWVLAEPAREHWGAMALVAATAVVMLWARVSPMWLIGAGAVLGALGFAG